MSVTIPFEIAKWNYEIAKKRSEGKYVSDSERDAQIGRMNVWKIIMISSCPKHEFPKMDVTEETYREDDCIHCGASSMYGDDVKLTVNKDCQTCVHMETEGGDSVSYGSTNVSLPSYSHCIHPKTEDMDEAQYNEWEDVFVNQSHMCPFWQGKI